MRLIQLSTCVIVAGAVTSVESVCINTANPDENGKARRISTVNGTFTFTKESDVKEIDTWIREGDLPVASGKKAT